MYKFTNGIIVFDEKTKDKYINAGYKLVEDKKVEESNENDTNDRNVEEKSKKRKSRTN